MLTIQSVIGIQKVAPALPASLVATALSLGVGIWSLALGLLNLGFIFDFISLPLVLGFVTGIALILIQGQVPAILGLVGIGPIFILQGPQIISKLGETKPITVGLSATSLLLLFLLQFVGKKWGSKHEAIRILAISRNIIVLSGMTLLSFLLNKDLETPLWTVIGPTKVSIPSAQAPNMALFKGLFFPSAGIAFGVAMEHVLLAKFMGHRNGYVINQSQELVSLGLTNIINSMIGGLPVGAGDLARASVNSESGVRSPLSGIITTLIVLGSMFVASDFIKWIPQSTLAAVIILATFEIMPAISNMGKYWKISFLDFMGFLLSFNFTLLAGAQAGVGLAFAIMVISTLMRTMFSKPRAITHSDVEQQYLSESGNEWANADRIVIPQGTQVISLAADIMYLNASRIKRHIVDTVFTNHSGKPASMKRDLSCPWNYRRDKHIADLRHKAGRSDVDSYTPRIRILVLDFSSIPFIDASGMQALEEVKKELRQYGGEDVDFRFVGMNAAVRNRFKRAGWTLEDFRDFNNNLNEGGGVSTVEVQEGQEEVKDEESGENASEAEVVKDLAFEILPTAVLYKNQDRRSNGSNFAYEEGLIMEMQKQV